MAISSGVGVHAAWLSVGGSTFPIEHGTVEQNGSNQSSTFTADLPMNTEGALEALASLGGNTASIIVESQGQTATLVTGEIDSVEVDFIDTTIKVSGRDQSAQLHDNKTSEKWVNLPGSNIVQQLAGRVGLNVQADASSLMAGKYVNIDFARVTDGISYAGAIHKLAEFDSARWWVKNGTLYYQSQDNPSGVYTLNYSYGPPIISDCLQLKLTRNVQASKDINVTVKSWHPRQKQVFTGQSNASGLGGALNYVFHIPNLTQDHAQQHAQAKANEISRNALTLEAEVVGDTSIDIAMDLELSGTGFFDGIFQMDKIHHAFGIDGYTMNITAKTKNPPGGEGGGDSGGSDGGSSGGDSSE
jgi:hypothetical protein